MNQQNAFRTVVITGANKGIGYSIAEQLYKGTNAYDIILTSRSEDLGQKAFEKITQNNSIKHSKLTFRQLDISDQESITSFSEWFKEKKGKVDVLINNAGIGYDASTTEEHLAAIRTNFHGTYNLTEAILGLLSDDGKIILVSSGAGELSNQGKQGQQLLGDSNLDRVSLLEVSSFIQKSTEEGRNKENGFNPKGYHNSKALLNAYVRFVLPKHLKANQQCYTMCPGWCKTDMGGDSANRSAEQGADTVVYLTNLPFERDEELNGKYFRDRKVIEF